MKSGYKRLGNYIQLVDERNRNLEVMNLLGISVTKNFIPSVANIVGTDMANYKILRKNQFACSIMQVRRDKKMPVALYLENEPSLISQAYPVFKIIDETFLLPEYLMMWFTRSEFDREACFLAVGGVRGSLEWEDFLNMELPIPSLEKQKELIEEYEAIENRIQLNKKLCATLEEAAQTIYEHWFEDFEFPDENGKPYKSSGGEMVECEELGKDIPKGWRIHSLFEIVKCNQKNITSNHNLDFLNYLDTSSITNNKISGIQYLSVAIDEIPSRAKRIVKSKDIIYSTVRPNLKHYGIIYEVPKNFVVSTGFAVISTNEKIINAEIVYQFLTSNSVIQYLHSKAENSVTTYPSIKPEDILNLKIVLPESNKSLFSDFETIFRKIKDKTIQTQKLEELKSLLLGKMAVENN